MANMFCILIDLNLIWGNMKLKKVPNHIGFIVDGNGRWAKKRNLERSIGHKFGVIAVKKIINALLDYDIKYASFFVFSTENFKRSEYEVNNIFELLRKYLETEIQEFNKKDIKLVVCGDIQKLPKDLQESLRKAIETTKDNKKLTVNMCLNYGGIQDIVFAVNNIISKNIKSVDENIIKENLYTKNLPSLDYVVRTSNEKRISNFMLYDLAYAELYFTKTFWPDFNKRKLYKALIEYQKRDRRFGNA